MSADEAMQPESTADELEVALPGNLETAANQPDDSDNDSDINFDSSSESEPERRSEDVAESPIDVSEEDADLEANAEPSVASISEQDADLAANIAADNLEELSEDASEDSAANIAADVPVADTSDVSSTSASIDALDNGAERTAAPEATNYDPELHDPDEDVSEQVANVADTDITEEPTADVSAAESSAASDRPAQDSASENAAAPPLTPSIPVQILQTVQTLLSIVLPILRAVTVLTLKITIRVLQFVVDVLDEPKPESAATSAQAPTSAANGTQAAQTPAWDQERTGAIAYSMSDLTSTTTADDDEDAEVKRVRFTIDDIYQDDGSLRPLPERLKEIWQDLIRVMRSPLPTAMNQQIPDRVFSVILVAVLAIVIWNLVTFILPSKSSPRSPQATKDQPTEVATPSATEKPTTDTAPEPTPVPDIAQPAPAPTVQPTPAPTATPQLELEPRDTVIEAIQQQVSEVTQRYADNLIQSVQANFRDGRLTVRVSDDWYRLEASQQDQVATDLLKRTKSLDFGKLELLDSQDNRVARSPIVGNKMLILQRDRTDVTGPIGTTATETVEPNNPEFDAAEPEDSIPVTSPVTSTNEV